MPPQPVTENWYNANQSYLMAAIAQIRRRLESHQPPPENADWDAASDPAFEIAPPALAQLSQIFGLSSFERDIVLLCAGMEFDRSWSQLCASAQAQPRWEYPTFSLALSVLSSPYWGAIAPDAPLRRWRLMEIGAGNALTNSPLRLDEQILHFLTGLRPLNQPWQSLGAFRLTTEKLVPSHQQLAEQMANCWVQASQGPQVLPLLHLCGTAGATKRAIAATACRRLGLEGYAITAQALPDDSHQLQLLGCLWEREWRLYQRVLLLDGDRLESFPGEKAASIIQLLNTLKTPAIVTSLERCRLSDRPVLSLDVHPPTAEEQRQAWQTALGTMAASLNGEIDRLVCHFNLSEEAIAAACWQYQSQSGVGSEAIAPTLWDACRVQSRPRLDQLAQRIAASANWEDLVLPPAELAVLQEITAHVRQRGKVYEQWGFAAKGQRGLGVCAMFAGASGTGKTLAAEVLSHTLQLDLYRIDLSSIVSKYIGETEKNLRRVFDAAEGGGVILLFDEADALFGKRTDVKDARDRHANIEVSYLLQRIEAYRGLAILTTNLPGTIDQAFLRRLRFIVQFPSPDATQRAQIWQRMFPPPTPLDNLNYQKLAKLNVAGGNIRNIALRAAFLAADADEPVAMKHLLAAAKSEYIKIERPLTDMEVKEWV